MTSDQIARRILARTESLKRAGQYAAENWVVLCKIGGLPMNMPYYAVPDEYLVQACIVYEFGTNHAVRG